MTAPKNNPRPLRVIVSKDGPRWLCRRELDCFRCGSCMKGRLEVNTAPGDRCRVCKAVVQEVEY